MRATDTQATRSSPPGFGPVLRNRGFVLLWLAQGLSQIAYHAVNFALVVLVETLTRSSLAVSFIILSFSLPAVLFSSLAGVLSDRVSKRLVMVVTTALRTVTLASLVLIDTSWPTGGVLAWLYLATFIFSTLSQFFGPAEGALIPRLVGPRLLVPANSLFNLTFFASQLLGFAVVGPLLAKMVGIGVLFQVTTALYAVCTVLVWQLPRDVPPVLTGRARHMLYTVWQDIGEGVRLIWADGLMVKAILYLSLASSAFLMLGAIGPAYVTRVLGIQPDDLGFIMAPAGLGIVAGLLLVTRLAHADNRERMIDLGLLGAGLATLVFALTRPALEGAAGLVGGTAPLPLVVGASMLVVGVMGGSTAFILVPAQTVLQERSPERARARVYAAFYTVSSAVALGPVLFAGAIGDLFGVTTVLLIVGLTFAFIGGLGRLRARGHARVAS